MSLQHIKLQFGRIRGIAACAGPPINDFQCVRTPDISRIRAPAIGTPSTPMTCRACCPSQSSARIRPWLRVGDEGLSGLDGCLQRAIVPRGSAGRLADRRFVGLRLEHRPGQFEPPLLPSLEFHPCKRLNSALFSVVLIGAAVPWLAAIAVRNLHRSDYAVIPASALHYSGVIRPASRMPPYAGCQTLRRVGPLGEPGGALFRGVCHGAKHPGACKIQFRLLVDGTRTSESRRLALFRRGCSRCSRSQRPWP